MLSSGFVKDVDATYINSLLLGRIPESYKGNYGHALLVCGSKGMMGAAVLSARGALKSGCGLVTLHIPVPYETVLYQTVPQAMLSLDSGEHFSCVPDRLEKYTAVGIGCGVGRADDSIAALRDLLKRAGKLSCKMILDVDAINMVAMDRQCLEVVPAGTVFTPHEGEFERLVGKWDSSEHKIEKLRNFAGIHSVVVVLKGHNTRVCDSEGNIFINHTGNAGMAKGGSGDVLTGLITGLLARGYAPVDAAVIGVYFHGKAGDIAAKCLGMESMNSGDIADNIVIE